MAECVTEVDRLATLLANEIASLSGDEQVDALNRARIALHAVSPFSSEPVDLVLWVGGGAVVGNDYNPNSVAPPEMRLLAHSIHEDGYTQPIVAHHVGEFDEVVDGFHRTRVGKEIAAVRDRVRGYLPIVRIKAERTDRKDRIAATIRHNRARGKHAVSSMTEIVAELHKAGWDDKAICRELGMDADEVLRLKQMTGLRELFADREYSKAWIPVDEDGRAT
jgi:ParB-like chromosome segregation protein Spo0J